MWYKRRKNKGGVYRYLHRPPVRSRPSSETDESPLPLDSIPDVAPTQVPMDTAKVYILHLKFVFGSREPVLDSEASTAIQQIINRLEKDPSQSLEIVGHTDDVGTRAYNQRLSEERAQAVYEILRDGGVEPSRMNFYGMGEMKPIVDQKTEAAREENRRVEIRFLTDVD